MNRRAPFVLVMLLLAVTAYLVDRPLIKTMILCAILFPGCAALGQLATRRVISAHGALPPRFRWAIWLIAGVVACAVFIGLLVTQPRLRSTYTTDHLKDVAESAGNQGFYTVQLDGAGNRYVWTQQQAAFAFNILPRRPVNVTLMMRSAAVAGGPDRPVRVEANGVEIGQLRPTPTDVNFQPFVLRFVPREWGKQQTEIRLLTTPFTPGKGDTRTLGTMVQSITVDTSESWSPITRHIWLLWMLPLLALAALLLAGLAPRRQAVWANYGAIIVCASGVICALVLIALILRIGFIEGDTYFAWLLGNVYIGSCFALAAVALPLGPAEAQSMLQHARRFVRSLDFPLTADRMRALVPVHPPVSRDSHPDSDTRRNIAGDLALVFVIALGIRLVWAVVIPPWLAPDELDHYVYVSHVAEQGQIPHPPYLPYPIYPSEYENSVRLTLSADIRATDSQSREELFPHFPVTYDYGPAKAYTAPVADRLTSAGARATTYPPLYYVFDALPYRLFRNAPILTRLFALRCGSAVFGALSCIFGYALAYEVRRCRQWGWALALCMAFLPMYVFNNATVNNDAAMDLFATALIWLSARAWLRPVLSPTLALLIGIASGLTLISKPTAFPVVVVAGAVILLKLWPQFRKFEQPRRTLRVIGTYSIGIIVLYGPWLAFRARYFGGHIIVAIPIPHIVQFLSGALPVAAMSHSAIGDSAQLSSPLGETHSFLSYMRYEFGHEWAYFHQILIKSFWGTFGWLDLPLANWVYVLVTIFCVVGLIGAGIQLVLQPVRRPILLLAWGFVLADILLLFGVVNYYFYRTTGKDFGLTGRYFFPALAPFLFLLLSGWHYLCCEHPIVPRLAPAMMLGLQLFSLATVVSHYYGVTIG